MNYNSADLIAAANDNDLLPRILAIGNGVLGIKEQDIRDKIKVIVASPVNGTGNDSIASVYAYAVNTYAPAPRPGENPAAVTDAHLEYALRSVFDAVI